MTTSRTPGPQPDVAPGDADDDLPLGTSVVLEPRPGGGAAWIGLAGELCPVGALQLRSTLDGLIDDGFVLLRVDLSRLGLCTSHGVDILERARRRLEHRGGSMRLVGAHGTVRQVFELREARLDDY